MAINGNSNGSSNGNGVHSHAEDAVPEWKLYSTMGMAAYRAPSLLQPYKARKAILDAHAGRIPPLIGMFCALGSPQIVKLVAQMGFDFVWVEWEHASMSVETMNQMVHDIHLCSEGRTAALVRQVPDTLLPHCLTVLRKDHHANIRPSIPGHDHAAIGYALDAGASIVIPQVDSVEQAKNIVAASKFGSKIGGKRSAPPNRWISDLSMGCCDPSISFWENQNAQAAVIIQIETLEGVHNLDAMLTAVGEHIDSVWLGSLDLRVSMGLRGFWGEEPEWVNAIGILRATLEKHNMPYSGLATGDEEWLKSRGDGRSLMFTCSDLDAVLGATNELRKARSLFPRKDYSSQKMANGYSSKDKSNHSESNGFSPLSNGNLASI